MYSRQELINLFNESDEKYSTATIKSYVSAIFNIARRFGHEEIPSGKVDKWVSIKGMDRKFDNVKGTTKRNYFSAIIALLKVLNQEGSPLFDELSLYRDKLTSEYERVVEKKQLTPTEEANWESFENIAAFYPDVKDYLSKIGFFKKGKFKLKHNDYDKGTTKKVRDAVYLSMYLYPFHDPASNHGPMRNDISSLKLYSGPQKNIPKEKENYFHISPRGNKGTFIMRTYKTEKRYGPVVLEIPHELTIILKKWAEWRDIKNDEFLFPNSKKSDITSVLQNFFLKRTQKKIGSQMLRKIYISHRFSDNHKDQEETAKSMLHSPETQKDNYSKNV